MSDLNKMTAQELMSHFAKGFEDSNPEKANFSIQAEEYIVKKLESKDEQIKILKEALEFYAPAKKYNGYDSNKSGEWISYEGQIIDDNGDTAREALKKIEEMEKRK